MRTHAAQLPPTLLSRLSESPYGACQKPKAILPLPSRTSQSRGQSDLEKGYSFPYTQGNLWQLTYAPPQASVCYTVKRGYWGTQL